MEAFKWGLVFLMVLDHLAWAWGWPSEWRLPGRLVFPGFAALMAHHLAQGVPPEKYLKRLLPFALVGQVGYSLLFGSYILWPLNVLFTFLGAALVASGKAYGWVVSLFSEFPLGASLALTARGKSLLAAFGLASSAFLMGWSLWVALVQGIAFLGFLTLIPHLPKGRRTPWWSFYAFYTGHLLGLYLVKALLR
ncbi:TraX family protein [Thermus albus]|uniref:TraX family protein n=1 Tax=Thermus albus TaxID=2908146 RepID=UPI001FAAF1CB|nr:TraX family protein [Thermus albus]